MSLHCLIYLFLAFFLDHQIMFLSHLIWWDHKVSLSLSLSLHHVWKCAYIFHTLCTYRVWHASSNATDVSHCLFPVFIFWYWRLPWCCLFFLHFPTFLPFLSLLSAYGESQCDAADPWKSYDAGVCVRVCVCVCVCVCVSVTLLFVGNSVPSLKSWPPSLYAHIKSSDTAADGS